MFLSNTTEVAVKFKILMEMSLACHSKFTQCRSKKTNNSSCCAISFQICHAHFQLTVNYRPIILPQHSENELQCGDAGREIFLPAVDGSAGARSDSRTTFAVSRGRAGADRRAELSAEAVNVAVLNYSAPSLLFNLPSCRATFTSLARCRVVTARRSCTAYPRRTATSK